VQNAHDLSRGAQAVAASAGEAVSLCGFFEMKNEEIIVYAVFHFSRNPRRWKKRSGG
jgi:hypothetical protein